MTDTHCHLDRCDDPRAAADPTLAALVTIGTDAARSAEAVALARELPNVWAAVGVHPTDASEVRDPEAREAIERLARDERVVAIGETGVDLYWDAQPLELQREAFFWQAELAAELRKPLVLHVRDKQGRDEASLAAAAWLGEAGHDQGILHCFNGHPELLRAGLELGWMVSFAGNLTYRSADPIRAAAATVPEDRLLVETDSPFLAPVPLRGRRNRPENVRLTAAFLAELRGLAPERLEALTDANAARVYQLPS